MDKRTERIYAMEDCIVNELGEAMALQAIIKAMSEDDKYEIFEYIIRCCELPIGRYFIEDDEEV